MAKKPAKRETHEVAQGAHGADVVTMDRRRSNRRTEKAAAPVERTARERRKTPRRRQIDPTTCERDYTDEEIEFMKALDQYKRANGRQFPTCSEVLEVIRGLGYQKITEPQATPALAAQTSAIEAGANGQDANVRADADSVPFRSAGNLVTTEIAGDGPGLSATQFTTPIR